MSNKRTHNEYRQRRELKAAGWEIAQTDRICFNGGSESNRHLVAKSQVAWYLSQQGYRIDSEVTNDEGTAEADIVAYGNDEPPFVVEVQTGITEDTLDTKLSQFYHNEPFCECYVLECNDLPEDRGEQLRWLQDELGGEL